VLKDLTLRIDNDDRIALLGSNGNGKSTLVKLIAGRLEPTEGKVTRAARLKIAYFAQHQLDELNAGESVYDHLRRLLPDQPESKVRAAAGALGFSGQTADTKVENLSGGEKARLTLGLATWGGPHLLILDEPTNHLDIDSRAALIEAINDFPGATILVSHDRHLLDACADRLWLVANRAVTPFDGDLEDYRRHILSDRSEPAAKRHRKDERTGKSNGPVATKPRVDMKALKKQVDKAESEIERLSKQIEALDAQLADGSLFARDPIQAASIARSRAESADALAKAEEDWLAAGAALQSASA
jgi:ATP-binding cassette subfamily F protein 3